MNFCASLFIVIFLLSQNGTYFQRTIARQIFTLLIWLLVKFGVLALSEPWLTFFSVSHFNWEIWKSWSFEEKKGEIRERLDEMPMFWRSWKFTLSRWPRVNLWGGGRLLLERQRIFDNFVKVKNFFSNFVKIFLV